MSPRKTEPIYVAGYERGLINAPQPEGDAYFSWAKELWLEGYADGQEDYVPGTPGTFMDP